MEHRIVGSAHARKPWFCDSCRAQQPAGTRGFAVDYPLTMWCEGCCSKAGLSTQPTVMLHDKPLKIILEGDPTDLVHVKVGCRCGESFVAEVPRSLASQKTGHECPKCSTIYFYKNGQMNRHDGKVVVKKADGSEQVRQNAQVAEPTKTIAVADDPSKCPYCIDGKQNGRPCGACQGTSKLPDRFFQAASGSVN